MINKLLIFNANLMAASLDFGVGTLIAAFVAYNFDVQLTFYLLFIGGVLALLPDLDLLPSVLSGNSASFDHRQTIFHRPLVLLPLAVLSAALLGGIMWGLITFFCVLWHYLHDTHYTNKKSGIAWFWPISKAYWSWWGPYSPQPLQSSDQHHIWLMKIWLRPTVRSVREVTFCMISLTSAAILSGYSFILVSAILLITLSVVVMTWLLAHQYVLVGKRS